MGRTDSRCCLCPQLKKNQPFLCQTGISCQGLSASTFQSVHHSVLKTDVGGTTSDSWPFCHMDPWMSELERRLPQPACVTTSTSDPLTLATFWPRGAARLFCFLRLYLGRVLLPRRRERLPSSAALPTQTGSALLLFPPSCLPYLFPLQTLFFFSLPAGKKVKKKRKRKKSSQIILPPAVTAAALSTPSHFSVSPVGKKRNAARERGKYLPEPVLLSLHFLLLFPAFIYLFPSFITASASWPLSFSLHILTSSVF